MKITQSHVRTMPMRHAPIESLRVKIDRSRICDFLKQPLLDRLGVGRWSQCTPIREHPMPAADLKISQHKRVWFDRALRTDVRAEWSPEVFPARSSVEEVGVESLSFDFPGGPYAGHFTELGSQRVARLLVEYLAARFPFVTTVS